MPPVWSSTLLRLLGLLARGRLIGWLYGQPGARHADRCARARSPGTSSICTASIIWLRTGEIDVIPDGIGVWPPVFAKIEYIREKVQAPPPPLAPARA